MIRTVSAISSQPARDARPAEFSAISCHQIEQAAVDSMMATYCDSIGAAGAVVALHEAGSVGSHLLFSAGVSDTETSLLAGEVPMTSTRSTDRPEWHHEGSRSYMRVALPVSDHGSRRVSIATFFKSATRDFRPLAEAAFSRIKPALVSFLRLWSLNRQAVKRLTSYASAMNRSEIGIILVGRDGAVLFANHTAEALLARADCLRRNGNAITANDLSDALKLQVAIEHVCTATATGETMAVDPVVVLTRRRPARPLLVSVSSPAADTDGMECDAGAILRVFDPDRDFGPLLEPVCGLYKLSPVETKLACLLAQGMTIEGAATSMRVKVQTARSYLKQIFLKTDTNRQSELVRLLLTSVVRTLPMARFRLV